MSHESKDTNKVINNVTHVATHVTEKSFDMMDQGAKNFSDWKQNQETVLDSYSDFKSAIATTTENASTGLDSEIGTVGRGNSSSHFVSRLRTSATSNMGSESKIVTGKNVVEEEMKNTTTENSKFKTGLKKGLSYLNQKTFQFKGSQGVGSKIATGVGKIGKEGSKGGRKVIKASKTLQRAVDGEDGAGTKFIQGATSRTLSKRVGTPLLKKLMKLTNKLVMKMARHLIAFLAGTPLGTPLFLLLIVVVSVSLIFGLSGSKGVVGRYENYMSETQERYDAKVDAFMEENPDGIVIGVRGNYGQIDWQAPLSILQGLGEELHCDATELGLLRTFEIAGLFERHDITEQEVKYEDEDGKVQEKTIKVLTIVNPSMDEYMTHLKSDFLNINMYRLVKNPTARRYLWFTKNQLDIIDKLYTSDIFFEEFSDEFKAHEISKGSNTTENNFNDPAYNSDNIFAKAGFKGQCTWYVYGRVLKLTGMKMPSGDAQTWLTSARASGYPTGSRPSKNAVVVLSGGQFGHVAFVESWDGKQITISEGNYNNPCSSGKCNMVDYANKHPVELVHEQTYSSFEEYKNVNLKFNGLTVVGFIYTD